MQMSSGGWHGPLEVPLLNPCLHHERACPKHHWEEITVHEGSVWIFVPGAPLKWFSRSATDSASTSRGGWWWLKWIGLQTSEVSLPISSQKKKNLRFHTLTLREFHSARHDCTAHIIAHCESSVYLLFKLRSYGFYPSLCTFISSFLFGRSISAVVDSYCSKPISINSGVPQGSVLSPTLFLLFINDLSITDCLIHCYVDDSTLHYSNTFKSRPS